MHEFSVGVLLFLSSLLGVESLPEVPPEWQIVSKWQETAEGYFSFTAINKKIIQECQIHPEYFIEFPSIIHSSTLVTVNEKIIATSSSPKFKHTRGFYGAIVIPCFQLVGATGTLKWHVKSYTQYFARFNYFPNVVRNYPKGNLFNETLNIIAGGVLLVLCFLYLILFKQKISKHKLFTLAASNFFTAIYFIGSTAGLFSWEISMLSVHKIADSGLWLGFMFLVHFLFQEGLIYKWMDIVYAASVMFSLTIIYIATTGDSIQLGTTIPFVFTIFFSCYAIFKLAQKQASKTHSEILQLIALFAAFLVYCNDILVVLGVLDIFPLLPVGVMTTYIFILLSVNERINSTYAERDQLKDLTQQLKQTNSELHHAQDKLVESEKMAVMGRAVARIAHELNTPIYSARSAMQNIQTQTHRFLDSKQNTQQQQILRTQKYSSDLALMSNVLYTSLSRAAELVRNFKEISVDQINVRKKMFNLLDYISTSLVTLEESLRRKNITVNLQGDKIMFHHDPSLFYQLINNLVSNTEKYAYSDLGGIIDIELSESPHEIVLLFADYGAGIPEKNITRIFDAFFTTGGGSKGLGLGLNIVYSIVTQKLNGQIHCISKENKGTSFTVKIPKGVELL